MLRSIIILISTSESDQLDHYLRICETWNTKTKCGGDARKIFNSPNPHTALFLTQNFPKFPQTPTFTGRAEFRSCNGHHSYEKTSLLRYFPYLPQRVWNLSRQWPPFLILKLPNPHDVHLTLFSTDSTSVRKLATGWPPIPRNGIATAVGNRGTKRRKFPQDLASRGVVARRAHLCAFIVLYSCS
jgi:hypothetical protein